MTEPNHETNEIEHSPAHRSTRFLLAFEIILLVLSAALFVILIVPLPLEQVSFRNYSESRIRETEEAARLFREPLRNNDTETLRTRVEMWQARAEVVYMVLEDRDGRPMAATLDNRPIRFHYGDTEQITDGDPVLRTRAEIGESGAASGTLFIGYDLEPLRREHREWRRMLAYSGLFISAVGSMAALWIASAFSKPLRSLVAAGKRATQGDLMDKTVDHTRETVQLSLLMAHSSEALVEARLGLAAALENFEDSEDQRARASARSKARIELDLAASRKERDRSLMILNALDDLVVLTDGSGKVEEINRPGSALLGLDRQEIIGQPWTSFVSESDRDHEQLLVRDAVQGEIPLPIHTQCRLVDAEGAIKTVAWQNRLITDGNRVIGLVRFGRPSLSDSPAERSTSDRALSSRG